MITDANKNEIEYALSVEQRKRDARHHMKAMSRVVNGEVQINNAEVVGIDRKLKSQKHE